MKLLRLELITIFSLLMLVACGRRSSVPVKKEPLGKQKQQNLRNTLVGTWEQTHRKLTTEADSQPVKKKKLKKWTFRKNGTGEIITGSVKPEMGKVTSSYDLNWFLEGRNLSYGKKGNESVEFRIDDWSQSRMTWFRYSSNSYFIVERVQ